MKKADNQPVAQASTVAGCAHTTSNNFAGDLAFLQQHTDVVVLKQDDNSGQIAVIPSMQGRVMTSAVTATGQSYGWVNYAAIASGQRQPQINVFGGEDRFWLGPEGGQYSIFFAPGERQVFANWHTPEAIDWGAWPVIAQTDSSISMEKAFSLANHAGSRFELQTRRTVSLLDRAGIEHNLGLPIAEGLDFVAYESSNQVKNIGKHDWHAEAGLLSVWILGMLKHSAQTVVAIPFKKGPEQTLGSIVKDDYFGKVADDRLVINHDKGVLFFKADGKMRSKIGISPKRAKSLSASYAPETHTLTLVQVVLPQKLMPYVNSQWTDDDASVDPYQGDVINSYNDGPNEDGRVLGPFYELESSSPALALSSGERAEHIHRTYHFQGEPEVLDKLTEQLLGITTKEMSAAL